jgi:di/tricarboxylate transporter
MSRAAGGAYNAPGCPLPSQGSANSPAVATPIGNRTNLMVFNAERYRFSDFLRVGPRSPSWWGS